MQIMEARALLTHELKKQNTTNIESLCVRHSSEPEEKALSHHEEPLLAPSPETVSEKASLPNIGTSTSSVDRNPIQVVDKSVIEEKHGDQVKDQLSGTSSLDVSGDKDEDDADDWLKEEETSETGDAVGKTIPIENEDVSFSDLEDDDADVPTSYRKSNGSSDKDSRDWVQLGKSASKDIDAKHNDKESNDWLDVDDIVVS